MASSGLATLGVLFMPHDVLCGYCLSHLVYMLLPARCDTDPANPESLFCAFSTVVQQSM